MKTIAMFAAFAAMIFAGPAMANHMEDTGGMVTLDYELAELQPIDVMPDMIEPVFDVAIVDVAPTRLEPVAHAAPDFEIEPTAPIAFAGFMIDAMRVGDGRPIDI